MEWIDFINHANIKYLEAIISQTKKRKKNEKKAYEYLLYTLLMSGGWYINVYSCILKWVCERS